MVKEFYEWNIGTEGNDVWILVDPEEYTLLTSMVDSFGSIQEAMELITNDSLLFQLEDICARPSIY